MSIKNIFGNWKSNIAHSNKNNIKDISNDFSKMLNNSSAKLSSLWNGGFVGIDTNNYEILIKRINIFLEDIDAITTQFARYSDTSGALKGQSAEAAKEYINEISFIINSYISFYKNFNILIRETAEKMILSDKENSNSIKEEINNVIIDANKIKIDE